MSYGWMTPSWIKWVVCTTTILSILAVSTLTLPTPEKQVLADLVCREKNMWEETEI